MLELRAVDEGAVPSSFPATSRLFVLPVATRRWVLTDNMATVAHRLSNHAIKDLIRFVSRSSTEVVELVLYNNNIVFFFLCKLG